MVGKNVTMRNQLGKKGLERAAEKGKRVKKDNGGTIFFFQTRG